MQLKEMQEAVSKAKATIYRANTMVQIMARLCAGRLRSSNADSWILRRLKRELRGFNITTGCWKDE